MTGPFDPAPRTLEPSTNGFVYCRECERPQPVAGHECASMENDPEQDDGFGRRLNDLTPTNLLNNAHWAHRLIDAYGAGGLDCVQCGCLTSNGKCTGCRSGTSPFALLQARAEFAESVLCAMAWDHARRFFSGHDELGCALCEAAR